MQDAADRYADIEVGYLLQGMERVEGIAILATILRGSIDEMLCRRLDYTLEFALPAAAERRNIYSQQAYR